MDSMQTEDLSTKEGIEKLYDVVKENFDKSTELSMEYMEKAVSVYNNHLNLALNFNKKFADNVNSQINAMSSCKRGI